LTRRCAASCLFATRWWKATGRRATPSSAKTSNCAEIEELEHKSRRRDILVDDDTLFEFYDQRISHDVISARHFDSWWKKASRETPDLLNFERAC
jgi:HrpA-like RNA helicase